MTDKSFRVTSGIDAAGKKIINVGTPDKGNIFEGVNIDFFNQHNGIQQYDPKRGYDAFTSVIYNDRIWYATEDIESPAGAFNEIHWKSIRNDPKWYSVSSTSTDGMYVNSGDFIVSDNRYNNLAFILPNSPVNGDVVVIKDGGGKAGLNELIVKTTAKQIVFKNKSVDSYRITHPYMLATFVYVNGVWKTQVQLDNSDSIVTGTTPDKTVFQTQAGMRVFRKTATGVINMQFPKYANDGDTIYTYDMDKLGSVNESSIKVHPESGHSINYNGSISESIVSKTSGYGIFVFDGNQSQWIVYDGNEKIRLKAIQTSVDAIPNDYLMVYTPDGEIPENVEIKLPVFPADGDRVWITTNYMRRSQACVIKTQGDAVIRTDKATLQFPKHKDYPPTGNWETVKEITITGYDDYAINLELSYQLNTNTWLVAQNTPVVERVDSLNPERVGVIALATQDEANELAERNPADEKAITPKTLSNRTATETRNGIIRLATEAEFVQDVGYDFNDTTAITPAKFSARTATETRTGISKIATQKTVNAGEDDFDTVTSKKLHNRTATETRTGIAKIANQDTVNAGEDDFDIVTSKKLHNKISSEESQGVIKLVSTNANETAKSGVYDLTNNSDAVTPKSLDQKRASHASFGQVQIANEDDVISGTATPIHESRVVIPELLHKKTATEERIGFTQNALLSDVETGTDDFKYVSPAKLKTVFDRESHILVDEDSGLRKTGTIWGTVAFDIEPSTETQSGTIKIATLQSVVDGKSDNTVVTPLTLHSKKATDTKEGIARFATNDEAVNGELNNVMLSPAAFKYLNSTDPKWGATETVRGSVYISKMSAVFVGNADTGSSKPYTEYDHDYQAVSPRGLNYALEHFLPKNGKAVDSGSLNGQSYDKWFNLSLNQSVTGKNKFTALQTFTETVSELITTDNVIITPDVNQTAIEITSKKDTTSIVKYSNINGENSIAYTPYGLKFIEGETDLFTIGGMGIRSDVNISAKSLGVDEQIYVSSVMVASAVDGVLHINNGENNIVIETKTPDSVTVKSGDVSGIVLTTANHKNNIGKLYLSTEGGTVYGDVKIIKDSAYMRITKNDNGLLINGGDNTGSNPHNITFTGNDSGINGDGKLTSFNIITKDQKGVTVNGNAVYHEGNKPTPDEIGAIARKDATVDTLNVINYIKIGKVKLVVNEETKSVEFVWEE